MRARNADAQIAMRHTRTILPCIIAIALLLRIGLLYMNVQRHPALFQTAACPLKPGMAAPELPWVSDFGFEIGNIAHAIVCAQQGFASPFGGSTGPTAWVAPGSVMVYCLAFKLFGCFSPGALFFLFGISLVLSAAIIVMVYRLGLLMFSSAGAAIAGAAAFALSLQDVELYFQGYQQDFNLHSFFFVLVFYLCMRYFARTTFVRLLAVSLCAGVALLFVPVLAFAIAAVLAAHTACHRAHPARAAAHVCAAVIVMGCVIGPYVLYQKNRTGTLSFIKSNGAFELYNGNSPESDGYLDDAVFARQHPAVNGQEFLLYSRLGEGAYILSKRELFKRDFDPGRFARTTARRLMYFFFVFRYHAELPGISFWMALRYIGYAVPGVTLVVFALIGRRCFNRQCGCMYAYILGYAFPYLLVAVMYRYSFPVATLTSVLLGALIHAALARGRGMAMCRGR